jgi:hypothetical protein
MVYKFYLITKKSVNTYITTEEPKVYKFYFTTKKSYNTYITTKEGIVYKFYFNTKKSKNTYFVTQQAIDDEYINICKYPSELENIIYKAIKLYYKLAIENLKSSIHYESYGKKCSKGYLEAGHLRILIDYLSIIWLERDNDSRSGLVRTSDYYYTKYNINNIIVNFRKCDINIKPIVALFDLNSYSVIDGNWPNYFVINNILNPPTEQDMPTLKQYTDIFTQEEVSLDSNQSVYPLDNAQINFPLTKTLKYLTNFSINGSDYIGYVDYNYTTIMYDAPQLNGYTITNSDTVTITYWYEE